MTGMVSHKGLVSRYGLDKRTPWCKKMLSPCAHGVNGLDS